MGKRLIVVAFLAAAFSFLSGASFAQGPAISLVDEKEWKDAIDVGRVRPMLTWSNAMEFYYPGMALQFRTANLKARKDVDPFIGIKQHGMVMAWGSAADVGQEILAGFEYVFATPADLKNTIVNVICLEPCSAINAFGIGLRDVSGRVMSWMWGVPGQPCDTQISVSVNPGGSGPSMAPTSTFIDGGFDLAQVTQVTFHQKGVWTTGVPTDPAGFLSNVWSSWRNLISSATVPVEETTWGRVKGLYKN